MKKPRAATALLLAALFAPAAHGGVMEADVASPKPTATPVTSESFAAPESSASTFVEVALDVVRAVIHLF